MNPVSAPMLPASLSMVAGATPPTAAFQDVLNMSVTLADAQSILAVGASPRAEPLVCAPVMAPAVPPVADAQN